MKLKEISVTWKFTWKTKSFIKNNINVIPFHLLTQYELLLKTLVPLKFYLFNYSLCSKNLSTILSSLCRCVGGRALYGGRRTTSMELLVKRTKLGPSGFPMFLTTESSHFFQILSFFFFKMFVVGMYLFVQVQMGTYAHVYAWSGQRPPFYLILWDSL